jgi:hypothetical protein
MWASIAASSLMKLAYGGVRRRNAVGVLVYKELGSRTAINQTLARKAERPHLPRDYRLHDHFQAPRRGEDAPPLRDASGYLVYPTWLNWCASAGRWLRTTAPPVSRPAGAAGAAVRGHAIATAWQPRSAGARPRWSYPGTCWYLHLHRWSRWCTMVRGVWAIRSRTTAAIRDIGSCTPCSQGRTSGSGTCGGQHR